MPIYALYVAAARLLGLKVIGWGLGVEPLWTTLGKLLARFVVGASHHFSVRDRESLRLLRLARVPTEKVKVASDPAFLISAGAEDYGDRSSKPHIIVCLRELSDNHPGINLHYLLPVSLRKRLGIGWKPGTERTSGLVRAAAAGVESCVRSLGGRVSLLALWPGRDDGVLRQVQDAAIAGGADPSTLGLVTNLSRPADIARFIASADLVVSMRLHALIFAARAGVPILALSYARKTRGLMRTLGLEGWTVEVESRTPPPEEVRMKLDRLWRHRHEVAGELRKVSLKVIEKAEGDADEIARILRQS
jgi:polysaccharide pyruvyl transferase WcaK-like protein